MEKPIAILTKKLGMAGSNYAFTINKALIEAQVIKPAVFYRVEIYELETPKSKNTEKEG